MESINEVVTHLQEIQEDLVGIIIPTIISAILSVLTLTINVITQFIMNNRQYKSKQYEIMREYYPQLKSQLIDISCYYSILKKNPLYNENFKISDYFGFDWELYRQSISEDDVEYIDEYQKMVEQIILSYDNLYIFFKQQNIPTSSNKIQEAVNDIHRLCAVVHNFGNTQCVNTALEYNEVKIDELIQKLDKHYNTF